MQNLQNVRKLVIMRIQKLWRRDNSLKIHAFLVYLFKRIAIFWKEILLHSSEKEKHKFKLLSFNVKVTFSTFLRILKVILTRPYLLLFECL